MTRRPLPAPPRTALSPDWREDGVWKISAMMASIPPDDYLAQARAFENEHLSNQTKLADWPQAWRDWCRKHSPRQPPGVAPAQLPRKRSRLFG